MRKENQSIMHQIIANKLQDLVHLCSLYKIDSLYVFGSFATGNCTDDSDIDILVTFGNVDLPEYFDNYMDFKIHLEEIFHRKVDLVEEKTIKNPILRHSIDRNKQLIYGRAS